MCVTDLTQCTEDTVRLRVSVIVETYTDTVHFYGNPPGAGAVSLHDFLFDSNLNNLADTVPTRSMHPRPSPRRLQRPALPFAEAAPSS